jgi:SPP1 gp7 family putative phage head morphogenesis protein
MNHLLEKYNYHKRRTLDRITSEYAARATFILQRLYVRAARDIYEALESGSSYSPDLNGLDEKLENILDDHFQKVVSVGVADGYREASPENELGTWLNYNLYEPIENTLPVELANYRKKLADLIERTIGDKKPKTFMEIIGNTKESQLDWLKSTYQKLAKDWLAGQDSMIEVKKALNETLQKGKNAMERVFRTETTRWFNESRAEYFENETTATHVQLFAVTDGRTSEICECRNGYVVPIEKAKERKYMPPFHPNCRTVQRALYDSLPSHHRLIEKGMAMDESTFVALPRGW